MIEPDASPLVPTLPVHNNGGTSGSSTNMSSSCALVVAIVPAVVVACALVMAVVHKPSPTFLPFCCAGLVCGRSGATIVGRSV